MMRFSRLGFVFLVVSPALGCGLLMPQGQGSSAPSTSGYQVPKESQDAVRKQEEQSYKMSDDQAEEELEKAEKKVQHALKVALGREPHGPGGMVPESSSTALAALRAANFKLRIEPVTDMDGNAVADNFVQLKDSFTDRVQQLQRKMVEGHATPSEMKEIQKGSKSILKLSDLRMQIMDVSHAALETNTHVQTGGMGTMLAVSNMVRIRKMMNMDFSDADYARVKTILQREKHWEAIAGATMGMLAAYEAVIGQNGDPKALDAIADNTLKAFPLNPEVSDQEAKDYVTHLSENAQSQKAKYEAWMRKTYGDKKYERQFKSSIDSMFDRAAQAGQQKSAGQMHSDTMAKYNADLAKCARGEPLDPGSLVGPAKCKEARANGGGGGGDDDSSSQASAPAGAQRTMKGVQQGMGAAQAAANGDVGGALQGAADMFPGDGPIHSSLEGVAALSKGDPKGAIMAAMNLVPGGSLVKEGLGFAAKLLKFI